MKTRFLLPLLLLSVASYAQTIDYKGTSVQLGPKAFLVDGNPEHNIQSPYVFKTFNDAIAKAVDGTVEEPMCIYIEPWVYWVDDPYNPEVEYPLPAAKPRHPTATSQCSSSSETDWNSGTLPWAIIAT